MMVVNDHWLLQALITPSEQILCVQLPLDWQRLPSSVFPEARGTATCVLQLVDAVCSSLLHLLQHSRYIINCILCPLNLHCRVELRILLQSSFVFCHLLHCRVALCFALQYSFVKDNKLHDMQAFAKPSI